MRFTITDQGTVDDIEVVQSYPPGVFEESAQRAVGKWMYKPKVQDGMAVAQYNNEVVITFQLEGNDGARTRIWRRLQRAYRMIVEEGELEQAENLLASIQNEKWLNLYELSALEFSYGMLSFSKKNFEDAVVRFERSNRFGETQREELSTVSNRLLVMSYVNLKDFKRAVETYDKLTLDGKLGESKQMSQIIERIRHALEDGRPITFN